MSQVINRIFIVGCPRSGTTLLQSILASHSQVKSFPESHVFFFIDANLRKPWDSLHKRFGILNPVAQKKVHQFLERIQKKELKRHLPKVPIFSRYYAKAFIEILDIITLEEKKAIWIEKTPQHLKCIQYIETVLPEAKFIHVIRNGSDVVASQYDASLKYPGDWKSRNTVQKCINSWKTDFRISLQYKNRTNHRLIKYENLVNSPLEEVSKLCDFMEINFEEKMLSSNRISSDFILNQEQWKAKSAQAIYNANGEKFYSLFNEQMREYILSKLAAEELNSSTIL